MNTIWKSITAIAVAVGFFFLIGYLELRVEMIDTGLALTWDLKPLQITTQNVAVVELILVFLVFAAVAFVFLTRRRGLSSDNGIPALVGGLTLVALATWYMATVDSATQLPTEMHETGLEFGWADVFETGGLSSTTHGMAALLLVIATLRLARPREDQLQTFVGTTTTG